MRVLLSLKATELRLANIPARLYSVSITSSHTVFVQEDSKVQLNHSDRMPNFGNRYTPTNHPSMSTHPSSHFSITVSCAFSPHFPNPATPFVPPHSITPVQPIRTPAANHTTPLYQTNRLESHTARLYGLFNSGLSISYTALLVFMRWRQRC